MEINIIFLSNSIVYYYIVTKMDLWRKNIWWYKDEKKKRGKRNGESNRFCFLSRNEPKVV